MKVRLRGACSSRVLFWYIQARRRRRKKKVRNVTDRNFITAMMLKFLLIVLSVDLKIKQWNIFCNSIKKKTLRLIITFQRWAGVIIKIIFIFFRVIYSYFANKSVQCHSWAIISRWVLLSCKWMNNILVKRSLF